MLVRQLILEIWKLTLEMSPYLLFGFLCAGFLHVFLKKETIIRYLAKPSFASVVKAAIIGTPMPLCSCGVIPVASHIQKEGASDGATVSFLTSTPNTGVDSIAATYALIGSYFAIIRPITAIISGVIAGGLVNLFSKSKKQSEKKEDLVAQPDVTSISALEKVYKIFHYAFVESISDIKKWLVIGIVVGAVIATFLPQSIVTQYLSNQWYTYFAIMLVGLPMYVCSTGSIPIAMAMASKGISPGAVLIFLIVGPATNSATMTYVLGKMGKKVLFVYLFALIVTALIFAVIIDNYMFLDKQVITHHHTEILPQWIQIGSACFFIFLLLYNSFSLNMFKAKNGTEVIIHVPSISCQGCARKIVAILQKNKNISSVEVDVAAKNVMIHSTLTSSELKKILEENNYKPEQCH